MKIATLRAACRYSLHRLVRILRSLGLTMLFVAGTAGTALAVVFPLWFFATRHSRGFTLFVLASLLAALLAGIVRALLHSARQQGGLPAVARRKLLPFLLTALLSLLFICALYGIILLFTTGRPAAGIIASAITLLLTVLITYIRRRNT